VPYFRQALAAGSLSLVLLLGACGESAVSGVNHLLTARDMAISERNLTAYADLIADDYQDSGKNKTMLLEQMQNLFKQFSGLKMESFGRDVFVLDDAHAKAAQSYRLKVLMDGSWREMLQREELSLIYSDTGWKISAGL